MSIPSPPLLEPLYQQQPPPLDVEQQQAYSGHGSIGPLIAVLAVIAIMGTVAVMIGRLCSGRGIMGRGRYDFESWMEKKCSYCIDGRVDLPTGRRVVGPRNGASVDAAPPVAAVEESANQEMVVEEETDVPQNPQQT